MRFERLTDCHDPRYEAARALYGKSFPRHEQREAASQAAILAHPAYRFNLIYDGDEFVGLLLCWETDDFIYVEHFCIEPGKRGRRYGSRALELLGAEGKTVILEIDTPVDEISIRRRGFYERAHFHANPHVHVHPAYHADCEGHALVVMSAPAPIDRAQYDAFNDYLRAVVMKDVY